MNDVSPAVCSQSKYDKSVCSSLPLCQPFRHPVPRERKGADAAADVVPVFPCIVPWGTGVGWGEGGKLHA